MEVTRSQSFRRGFRHAEDEANILNKAETEDMLRSSQRRLGQLEANGAAEDRIEYLLGRVKGFRFALNHQLFEEE